MLNTVLLVLLVAFPASEVALALSRRADARSASVEDDGSLRMMWIAIGVGLSAAWGCSRLRGFALPLPVDAARMLAVVLLLGGLGLRWASILILGRHFTVNVAIQRGHALVERGPYRYLRHPSYTGLLLTFTGLALVYMSWLSLLALLLPITLSVLRRIATEERALAAALGESYSAYRERTWRLLPWIY